MKTVTTKTEQPAEVTPETSKPTAKKVVKTVAFYGVLVAIVTVLFGVVFALTIIRGESMEGSYHDGEIYLGYRIGYTLDRGDVIAFKTPTGRMYIKRIIGLPGDTIQIDAETASVYRNGELLDEPYLGSPTTDAGIASEPITVEEGFLFVMGDNREHSSDSRSFGLVPFENVKAEIGFRLLKT